MAEKTGITWADATINFWHGCIKVSEGCKFCYMYRDKEKYGQEGNIVRQTKETTIERILRQLKLQRIARLERGIKEPLKIFTCSWSDFFIEEADAWRGEAWHIIRQHPEFVWIILTKRPERIKQCLPLDWGEGWGNVWLLVSAENQERFNERVPLLLDIPAKVHGVSCEPLIGEIDMLQVPKASSLDWVIIGGESGNENGKWKYRPTGLNWINLLIVQCTVFAIPVFMKQFGTSVAKAYKLKDRHGEDWDEWDKLGQGFKFRQFPELYYDTAIKQTL